MIIADAGALSLHAPPAAGGSVTVTPTETTSYTLTAPRPRGPRHGQHPGHREWDGGR